MNIHLILREKRRALGLTQEQIANYLGVTTPAVNKWEKGAACPDIALLPALARLLKTDPNTLLSFQEQLTPQEITTFLNASAESIRAKGFCEGFRLAMEKVRDYPTDAAFLEAIAVFLDGARMMSALAEEETRAYRDEITALYRRVVQSDDPALANRAKYMLASRLLQEERYEDAQKMLDSLPKWNALDPRLMQADIFIKTGKSDEAAVLLERKLLTSLNDDLATLLRLVRINQEEGDTETARRLSAAARQTSEAFGLWGYNAYVLPLEVAVLEKNVPDALSLLRSVLDAVQQPWDPQASPLCRHFPKKDVSENFGKNILPALINELTHSPDYTFLQEVPEFLQLLQKYRDASV